MRRLTFFLILLLSASSCWALQKNVASQKWVVFAFDLTDNTAKTGDAAQITAEVSIDGAAGDTVDDTNPTELEDGYYVFDIAQAETNGDYIVMMPESSTGDIQVIGVPMGVWTTAPYFSVLSIDSSGRLDIIKVAGTTQTANDMSGDINTILTDTEAQDTTTEIRTLMTGSDTTVATQAKQDTIDNYIDSEISTIVTAVGNIETDTAAYDTDAEYATAIWNALTNAYGGAGTYGQVAEDVLVDTGTTLDDFIDTEISTIVTAVGNIETDTAAQDTAGEWDTLMATVDGKLDTAQADLDTITGASGVLIDTDAVDADALKADAVTEFWAAAMSDLAAGTPSATASVLTAINYIYEAWRNQTWATSTEIAIYKDDASTPLVESTISDDGTTFKREEMRAPD